MKGKLVGSCAVVLLALASPATASEPDAPGMLHVRAAGEVARVGDGTSGSGSAAGPLAASVSLGWAGVRDPTTAPPDATGAVGDTRYVALVNRKFAIYDKASTDPIKSGTLNQFAGVPATNTTTHPQIIWDPQTSRFYYLMLTIPVTDPPNADNRMGPSHPIGP
jgi:hypothetical protein